MVKHDLLNNVKLLYLVVILSHLLLFYLILDRDTQGIFLFSVIALIVYLLNNNMIIVLIIPTVLISILILINKNTEGLENKEETTKKTESNKETPKKEPTPKKKPTSNKEPMPKIEKLDIKKIKYNNEKTKMINELIPLSNALEKINIEQINTMVNNLNKIIERF